MALKAAKQAKLDLGFNTELILADYSVAPNSTIFIVKQNRMYNYVKDLVERDCGVEAVGFDGVFDLGLSDVDIESISENMKRYGELGLKVHFTGVEIRCGKGGSQTDCDLSSGDVWTDDMLENQARRSLEKRRKMVSFLNPPKKRFSTLNCLFISYFIGMVCT